MLNINSILGNIFKDSSLEYTNFEKLIISRIDLEKRILRKKTNLGTDIGINLNHPEAVAILSDHILEGARDGRSVPELMSSGKQVLKKDQVLPGVPELIHSIQVEATFDDGTKLVTVHDPIGEN